MRAVASMNICMAVQTRTRKKFVLPSRRSTREGMKIGVRSARMGSLKAVAVLAEERHLLGQKLAMVASVGLMADQTILHHRDMLPHKGPSFFRVAFVAEFIDGIPSQHLIRAGSSRTGIAGHGLNAESTHRVVAAGTLERLSSDKRLIHGMMGLLT